MCVVKGDLDISYICKILKSFMIYFHTKSVASLMFNKIIQIVFMQSYTGSSKKNLRVCLCTLHSNRKYVRLAVQNFTTRFLFSSAE